MVVVSFPKNSAIYIKNWSGGLATRMKTVNGFPCPKDRRLYVTIATDWFIGGCLKRCLMYSRNSLCWRWKSNTFKAPGKNLVRARAPPDEKSMWGGNA